MGLARTLLVKGNRCLSVSLYDEAMIYYTRCLNVAPSHDFVRFNMGLLRLRQGRAEEGRQYISDAVTNRPELAERIRIGGNGSDTPRLIESLVDQGPSGAFDVAAFDPAEVGALNNEPAVVTSVDLDVANSEDDARQSYAKGVSLMEEGDLDAAMVAFHQAIKLDPVDPYAYNELAAMCMFQNEWEAAIPWLEKAVTLRPEYVEALHNLGTARRKLGHYEAALAAFHAALALNPDLESAELEIDACVDAIEAQGDQEGTEVTSLHEETVMSEVGEGTGISEAPELETVIGAAPVWDPRVADRKGAAEFHRLALVSGFLSVPRVSSWVDVELGVAPGLQPLATRLALGEAEETIAQAAEALLSIVPGSHREGGPARALLGLVGMKLTIDASLLPKMNKVMARVLEEADLPDEDADPIGDLIARFAKAMDPPKLAELIRFLQRYKPDAEEYLRSGRIQ